MQSVMSYSYAKVPTTKIPRSQFNLSRGYKTTFDVGKLVPFFVDEIYPGDTFNVKSQIFARVGTLLRPIMDNMYLDTFFFFIPNRLVWDNWEKFCGAQTDPGDSIDYTIPTVTASGVGGHGEMSLYDYFGIPTKVNSLEHNNLIARCYNLCWNEWFRDQNLQDSVTVDTGDGPDTVTNYVLLDRGKRHDYFTSCLPWPQKGDAVDLPLGSVANVIVEGSTAPASGQNLTVKMPDYAAGDYRFDYNTRINVANDTASGTARPLVADLSTATAATVNELREAFQIQKMLEKDARGGTRYVEVIKSHFRTVSPDFRVQRPEYLGGGSAPIIVNPVSNTSADGTNNQGDLTGLSYVSTGGHGFVKSFTEHGIVIGMVNVRGDITYQQGLDRMHSRQTRYDFYWPSLAHIGEQAVLNKEIYADGSANDELVFGYQERYGELRFSQSKITGLFRSNATSSLDVWHLSEEFGSLPSLNSTFIVDSTPADRVVATPAEPHIIFDSYTSVIAARPLPAYGVPGLIDHF